MTGLELCRRIADAVIAAYESEGCRPFDQTDARPDHRHPPTLAVLATLEAAGAGLAIEGRPEDLPGQVDLFELHDRR